MSLKISINIPKRSISDKTVIIIIIITKLLLRLSSKIIELSGAPSGGVGQTHSPGTMRSSPTNDQLARKLRKD